MTHEEAIEIAAEHYKEMANLFYPEDPLRQHYVEVADALSSPPVRSARDEAIERALIDLSSWTARHLEATCPGCGDPFDSNPSCRHGLDKFPEYQNSINALAVPKGEA